MKFISKTYQLHVCTFRTWSWNTKNIWWKISEDILVVHRIDKPALINQLGLLEYWVDGMFKGYTLKE